MLNQMTKGGGDADKPDGASTEAPGEAIPQDRVLVGGPSPSGRGVQVLRSRDGNIEVGELRTPREGQAMHGELVKLSPTEEHERLFDVEVMVDARPPGQRSHGGPPQVATAAYRAEWERIFGKGGADDASTDETDDIATADVTQDNKLLN